MATIHRRHRKPTQPARRRVVRMPLQPRSFIQNLFSAPAKSAKMIGQPDSPETNRSRRPTTHADRNFVTNLKRKRDKLHAVRRQGLLIDIQHQVPPQRRAYVNVPASSLNAELRRAPASISRASVNANATVSKPGPRFAEVAGSRRCNPSLDPETARGVSEIATPLLTAFIAAPQLRAPAKQHRRKHRAPASPSAEEPSPVHAHAIPL